MYCTVFRRGGAILLYAGALSLGPSAGFAGQHQCSLDKVEGTESAQKNFDCLLAKFEALASQNATLSDKLTQLEEQPADQGPQGVQGPPGEQGPQGERGPMGPSGKSADLPAGIVVASKTRCSLLDGGWTSFEDGAGRVIVGVGATKDERGETRKMITSEKGGSFQHQLSIAEMPRHEHGGIYGSDGTKPRATNDHRSETNHNDKRIVAEGGGQPHNNMPPFVALYLCEKR